MISSNFLGIYITGMLEMKSTIAISALVLMAVPLVSAGKLIAEDSGPCVLQENLNNAISVLNLFVPWHLPSLVRTGEKTFTFNCRAKCAADDTHIHNRES